MKLYKKMRSYFIEESDLGKADWIFFCVIFVICGFLFWHRFDLPITIEHSNTMIDSFVSGTPWKFYGDVYQKAFNGGYSSVLPSITWDYKIAAYSFALYFALAVVNLPLYMMSKIVNLPLYVFVLWDKIIIMALTIYCGMLIKKCAEQLGIGKKKSKWVMYAFLTSPILLFGSTAFGQLDIVQVVFMCLGFLAFLKSDFKKFCLWFAIAIDLKLFAVVAFLVLVLLVEKRLFHIIKYLLAGCSLYIMEIVIFSFSNGKALSASLMKANYNFKGFVFEKGVNLFGEVTFSVAAMIVVFAFAYFIKIKNEEDLKRFSILMPLTAYIMLFNTIYWHPQWIIIVLPFAVLSMFYFDNFRINIICDIAYNFGFLAFLIVRNHAIDVSVLLSDALFHSISGKEIDLLNADWFADLLTTKLELPNSIYFTVFFIGGILIFVFKFLQNVIVDKNEDIESNRVMRGYVWFRACGILMLIIPFIFSYYNT